MDDFLIYNENEIYSRYRYSGNRAELDYQESIVEHSKNLFPSYYVFLWSKHLKTKRQGIIEGVACDVIMIHKELKEWWIVEVERIEHDIYDHVLDQMDRLITSHEYKSIKVVEHILKKIKENNFSVDLNKVESFLYQNDPEFLIIDESYVEERKNHVESYNKIKKLDLRYSSLTRFKSNKNKYTFIKAGYDLEIEQKGSPEIRIQIDSGGNLVISQPKRLNINFNQGEKVYLIYDRKLTTWDVYEAQKTITLTPSCETALEFKLKSNEKYKLHFSKKENHYKIVDSK